MNSHHDQRVYPAHAVAMLVRVMTQRGTSPADVLNGSDMDPVALQQSTARISLGQMVTVFRNACALTNDPMLAVDVGSRMHVAACGLYGYALLCSASHAHAVNFISTYDHLVSPFTRMTFALVGNVARWGIDLAVDVQASEPLYRFMMELKLCAMLTVHRDLYGPEAGYRNVHVVYDAPAHADRFQSAMGCAIHYNAPANEVGYDAAMMLRPMPYANDITHATLRELCDQESRRIGQRERLTEMVYATLLSRTGRFPDINATARELSMNGRTLQRRLAMEGSCYRDLVAKARVQLAISYLRSTDLSIENIAARLGYSDATSFRHAFKRWTQAAPGAFR